MGCPKFLFSRVIASLWIKLGEFNKIDGLFAIGLRLVGLGPLAIIGTQLSFSSLFIVWVVVEGFCLFLIGFCVLGFGNRERCLLVINDASRMVDVKCIFVRWPRSLGLYMTSLIDLVRSCTGYNRQQGWFCSIVSPRQTLSILSRLYRHNLKKRLSRKTSTF